MHYNGSKRYEITNHLGNVLATITDRRIAAVGSQDWQTALYFRSEPVQVSDYEPFGSELVNRTWTRNGGGTEYRYGFILVAE